MEKIKEAIEKIFKDDNYFEWIDNNTFQGEDDGCRYKGRILENNIIEYASDILDYNDTNEKSEFTFDEFISIFTRN